MKYREGAVVTPNDLKQYVKKKGVQVLDKDGRIQVSSDLFEFEFEPVGTKYSVKIQANDDPSDSDETNTTNPIKFIARFLGSDIPGGEHFERMSSYPRIIQKLLHHTSARVASESIGPSALSRILRRIALISDFDLLSRSLSMSIMKLSRDNDIPVKEIDKLKSQMKSKGWVVEEYKNDLGVPELKVDVSGIYEATISVFSISYKYDLSVVGFPDLDQSGTTDDPINQIRNFVKSDTVQNAIDRRHMETGDTESAPSTDPKSRDIGNEKTELPGKHKPDQNFEKTTPVQRHK